MDPFTMMAVAGGVQAGAGLLGSFLGGAQDEKALEYRKQALAQYLGVSVPQLEEMVAKEQGATQMSGVHRDAGQEALADEMQGRLAERARTGGWDAQSRATYARGQQDAATYERGQREALAHRYAPGTGAEVLLQAQAQQSGADRAAASGMQASADAEARAMQAILQGGNLATQRSAQHWDEDAQVAAAQDRINEFNTATANNFTLANQEQKNQHFNQQMHLADAKAGAMGDMAGVYERKGDTTRATVGGIGQGVGYGLAQYGMYGATQPAAPSPAPAYTGVASATTAAQADPYGMTKRRKVG